ncbi:EF-hand domain-containing protein [Kiloniella sp.]|uniref:EF-hand domain-containing protein n=1 Tax=Kiloniella sp. TaxID=1938587 RepID=UPI003B0156E4
MSSVGSTQDSMMMQQLMQQQMFQTADTNGSGGLNVDEFASLLEQKPKETGRASGTKDTTELFASIDLDNSGELTQEELQSFHQDRMGHQERTGGRPPAGMMSNSMQDILLQLQEEGTLGDLEEAA